jgi:hypothetical protein
MDKKILLIGDSIRMSYQELVQKKLDHKAIISGPSENCRFSAYTLFNLPNWVNEEHYDIIQWNNGQWDTCYMEDNKIHTSLNIYLEYQQRICEFLKKKTDRLIFATTTPVWNEMMTEERKHYRNNEDIVQYNNAVVEMLNSNGVEINDIHSVVSKDIKHVICDDMVHLNDTGKEIISDLIVSKFSL